MPAQSLPKPIDKRSHAAPHNKSTPEREAQILQMLRNGATRKEVTEKLGTSNSTMHRILRDMRTKGTAAVAPLRNPTHCTHQPACPCVWHQAEAYRKQFKPARVIGEA